MMQNKIILQRQTRSVSSDFGTTFHSIISPFQQNQTSFDPPLSTLTFPFPFHSFEIVEANESFFFLPLQQNSHPRRGNFQQLEPRRYGMRHILFITLRPIHHSTYRTDENFANFSLISAIVVHFFFFDSRTRPSIH